MCVADGCVGPESVRIDEIFPVKFLTRRRLRRRKRKLSPKNFSELFCPKSAGVERILGRVGFDMMSCCLPLSPTRLFISHVFLFSKIPSRELHKINVRSGGVRCFCSQKWVAAGGLVNYVIKKVVSRFGSFPILTFYITNDTGDALQCVRNLFPKQFSCCGILK